jgi:hypothetical protein
MSPRKNNVLTVEGWPDPKPSKLYKGRVEKSETKGKPKCLHVTIENLDPSQLGRIHDVSLPLPVRPGNLTSSFLMACGIDVSTVGTKVCLDNITDAIIGMRFGMVGKDGAQQVDFEKIKDSQSKQTESSVENSRDQSVQW